MAPSGRFGAYGTREELTIFNIVRIDDAAQSAATSHQFNIGGDWAGGIAATFDLPVGDLFWTDDDRLIVLSEMVVSVQESNSSWTIANRWRYPPNQRFIEITLSGNRLVCWNGLEMFAYSLADGANTP